MIAKIIQFIFCSFYTPIYFFLTRIAEMLHKRNSAVLNFTSCYMHIVLTLSPFGLLTSEEGQKGKGITSLLSSLLCHHFQLCEEKKRMR